MTRTAFLGTPRSALPMLEVLTAISEVCLVVTQPARPQGRSSVPVESPVAGAALTSGLRLAQPTARGMLEGLMRESDVDVAVVAAFGMIIPAAALSVPRHGMLNVHFSLLPRWRGAAPVARAILAGDSVTGVSLMQMDAGLDTGGVLADWATSVEEDEDAGALTDRLAIGGAELLRRELDPILAGDLQPEAQNEAQATYAKKLSTEEARIDFATGYATTLRGIRAFQPRPGAHTTWAGERFKIHQARRAAGRAAPGLMDSSDGPVTVGTGDGRIELLTVQPAGAKAMAADAWVRGLRTPSGSFG